MKNIPNIGDKVTVTKPVEAYYSGPRSGNPVVIIQPGEIGVVKSVKVPSVRREGVEFCCVDFEKPGIYHGDPKHNNTTWRIGVGHQDLQKCEDTI